MPIITLIKPFNSMVNLHNVEVEQKYAYQVITLILDALKLQMFIPLTKGAAPLLKNACVHLVLKLLIRMYCAISTQVAFCKYQRY